MTETTEGLTRRMSSGSDSPSARAVAAAKKKRATSASHGGSLRFNISGAFFSKKEFGARGFQRLRRGGVQRAKPKCARRASRRGVRPLCRDSRRCQSLYVETVSGAVL